MGLPYITSLRKSKAKQCMGLPYITSLRKSKARNIVILYISTGINLKRTRCGLSLKLTISQRMLAILRPFGEID